jgi:hypothetical protein
MSRYDLTDSEWRVIEPLLPNKPRGVPHKIVAGEFCKFRFDIELPPSSLAANLGCPPLLDEPEHLLPQCLAMRRLEPAETPPILPASSSGAIPSQSKAKANLPPGECRFDVLSPKDAGRSRRKKFAGSILGVSREEWRKSEPAASAPFTSGKMLVAVAAAADVSIRRRWMLNGKSGLAITPSCEPKGSRNPLRSAD